MSVFAVVLDAQNPKAVERIQKKIPRPPQNERHAFSRQQ